MHTHVHTHTHTQVMYTMYCVAPKEALFCAGGQLFVFYIEYNTTKLGEYPGITVSRVSVSSLLVCLSICLPVHVSSFVQKTYSEPLNLL